MQITDFGLPTAATWSFLERLPKNNLSSALGFFFDRGKHTPGETRYYHKNSCGHFLRARVGDLSREEACLCLLTPFFKPAPEVTQSLGTGESRRQNCKVIASSSAGMCGVQIPKQVTFFSDPASRSSTILYGTYEKVWVRKSASEHKQCAACLQH